TAAPTLHASAALLGVLVLSPLLQHRHTQNPVNLIHVPVLVELLDDRPRLPADPDLQLRVHIQHPHPLHREALSFEKRRMWLNGIVIYSALLPVTPCTSTRISRLFVNTK